MILFKYFLSYFSIILISKNQKQQIKDKLSFYHSLWSIAINKNMINLQTSRKLIRTYQQVIPKTLSNFSLTQNNYGPELSARLASNSQLGNNLNDNPFGRTVSKMIKIQFSQQPQPKHSNQIRIKRKMMTSTQKFQARRKNNYASSLKDAYTKAATNQRINHSFLTVGSHGIHKMDYNNYIHSQQYQLFQDNFSLKKRLHSGMLHGEIKSVQNKKETNSSNRVLILKKAQNTRLDDLLFKKPVARQISTKVMQRTASLIRATRDGKSVPIEEYIPTRKNTSKKQPFVFGLGDKLPNSEKNKQKLLLYHDFLWKINYSNGLYVRASDQQTTYKAFIGFGNNSNLIKSILKRRYWWTISDKSQGCQFIWTQLKLNFIFKQLQGNSSTQVTKIYFKSQENNQNLTTEPIMELQEGHERIFNKTDLLNWNRHIRKNRRNEATITDRTYKNRAQFLSFKEITRIENSQKLIVHNHIEQNYYIGNKKSLFYHMRKFYEKQNLNVFTALPETYHISKGVDDPVFKRFQQIYQQLQKKKIKDKQFKNVWIMKPGQNSNRGTGITVCYSLEQIRLRIKSKEKNSDGSLRTYIVQKYMEKPLLYKGRKFDIRHYLLLTSSNGIFKAYWFPQGYIRTSSSPFSLKRNTNLEVHLTNDAIQKNTDQYGKYQKGNKVSYQKFQNYLNKNIEKSQKNCFFNRILPEMKELTLQAVKATYLSLDPNRKQHNFELLGMDFMIDEELKPWLIQINTNPCLQLSSPLLSRLIPSIIDQTMRICVDPFFPPPDQWTASRKMFIGDNLLEENQFELIFDEAVDGEAITQLFGGKNCLDLNMGKIEEDVQTFENQGTQQWQQK